MTDASTDTLDAPAIKAQALELALASLAFAAMNSQTAQLQFERLARRGVDALDAYEGADPLTRAAAMFALHRACPFL